MQELIRTIEALPMRQQLEPYREALRAIYKRSLYKTCSDLLGYKDITKPTHGGIVKCLQSESKRKLIVVPRGCFKSTIASVGYPIWLLTKDPNLRILLDSELFTNSSKFLREIKGHLISEQMTNLFGEWEGSVWNDSEIIVRQRTKNLKEASITCSGIGAQKTSQHYDVIIADDMNSPDNSGTAEMRQKVIDHYKMYISLLEPGGILCVIGTRYAYDDLIGHILDNEVNKKGLLK
jgi:hypothetical protein